MLRYLAFALPTAVCAQAPAPAELILQLQPDARIEQLAEIGLAHKTAPLAADWGIYWVQIDTQTIDLQTALRQYRRHPAVRYAQPNRRAQPRHRCTDAPNDPRWSQQWNLELIGALEAWQTTTGGLTPQGDTIVIAVLDGGGDFRHEDLRAQYWTNRAEIPQNGLDDDQNGYRDDYRGWNPNRRNDALDTLDGHSTSIAGIIAAQADNRLGTAGINWQAKIMAIQLDNILESEIIAGYAYAAQQRRRYNQTNGQAGAFVVATNASFGIDGGQPEDYPIWCAVFDSLGALGILNAAATTNNPTNVDVRGDVPSSCASDFLIVTSSTTRYGVQDYLAGYGAVSVDISAPTDVWAPRPDDAYGLLGGTSAASPHVAAAIALLASFPDSSWAAALRQQPATTALRIKTLILESAARGISYAGKNRSQGRLDLATAVQHLREYLQAPAASAVLSVFPNPSGDFIWVQTAIPAASAVEISVFDLAGRPLQTQVYQADTPQISYLSVNVQALPPAVYVLRVRVGAEIFTQKIVRAGTLQQP